MPRFGERPCTEMPPAADGDSSYLDRRDFLRESAGGLGGIALAHLLGRTGLLA